MRIFQIADKNSLLCYRAIPAQYKKAKLMEVPVEELNCTVADTATTNLAQFSFTTFLTATIGAFVLNQYHFQLVSQQIREQRRGKKEEKEEEKRKRAV